MQTVASEAEEYMAPEVINILNQEVANPRGKDVNCFPDFYDLRCDVWSLGVCIHTLLEGELPYDMEDMSKFIAEGAPLPKLESSSSPSAADFVKECLLIDFRVRPGAKDLLKHRWLTEHQCGPTPHSSSTIASRLRAFSKLSKFKRAALLAAARHLGSYEHEELRCIFQKVDVHHQGEVPLTDLMEYLAFAPASPSSGHQWVAEAVSVLDAQCKGETVAGEGQWYFMSDLRKMKAGVDDPHAWTKYDAKMNKQLETAYSKGFKQYTMTFKDKQYIVKFLHWKWVWYARQAQVNNGCKTAKGLLGVVWQTKVDRRRRGTRFAVPRCSLSGSDWVLLGWKAFQPFRSDRDFLLWDLQDSKNFSKVPISYTRGLAWLKFFLLEALQDAAAAGAVLTNEVKSLEQIIPTVTWHSMRVTFLAEAVRAKVDDKVIGLQANWKDPKELVLKYARQRKELSVEMIKDVTAEMIKDVTAKMRSSWTPDPAAFVMEEEDQEMVVPISAVEYFVKKSLPERSLQAADFKCHIFDRSTDAEVSLCGRLKLEDAVSVALVQAPLEDPVTMVDRTTYADEAHTPKIALRQIFGRLGLREPLCRAAADASLLTVEVFAMLGDTAANAKTALRTLIPAASLGTDAATTELSLMQLAAVWHSCHALQGQFATRRARMEEDPNKIPELAQEDHAEFRNRFVTAHPDVILLDSKEPHKKFVEKLNRDFLVLGILPYYTVAEIRTRADAIVQKAGLSKSAEDLLSISKADEPDPVTDVQTLLHRVHAFFMALEYMNICSYSRAAGPLKYLQELEQFRSECPGLPYVMAADGAVAFSLSMPIELPLR
eukprot:Skav204935  [mRNA]  locus=scaffold2514:68997:87350:+ [translate_table: standard]